jgi:hypothetical protein
MADRIPPPNPQWAWEPYRPSAEAPWDVRRVGHLYRRAAFGATAAELDEALHAGPTRTLDRLLAGGPGLAEFDRSTASMAESIGRDNDGVQLRAWWLYRMLYSPHPLQEKLTLFWHNHFATSNAKVQNAKAMLGQYELMRQYALGRFDELLQKMSKDPAMLVWLDGKASAKGNPNENYARELMELFSLGIGNYTEKDIRDAARAFTGWDVDHGKAVFDKARHDDGTKSVLGRSGAWQGDDVVRICLEQPAAALFVVGKLYRFLVSETVAPSPELLKPLADKFRSNGYDFGALVRTVLGSNLFFADVVYRTRIKSPVEFALGIVRGLEGHIGTTALATTLEALGQNVFYPPSVKGWDGGPAWLNGQTLLFRQNLTLGLTSTEDPRFGSRTDPAALVRRLDVKTGPRQIDFFLRLFLQGDAPAAAKARLEEYQQKALKQTYPTYWSEQDVADQRVRSLCYLVLSQPEFQLA